MNRIGFDKMAGRIEKVLLILLIVVLMPGCGSKPNISDEIETVPSEVNVEKDEVKKSKKKSVTEDDLIKALEAGHNNYSRKTIINAVQNGMDVTISAFEKADGSIPLIYTEVSIGTILQKDTTCTYSDTEYTYFKEDEGLYTIQRKEDKTTDDENLGIKSYSIDEFNADDKYIIAKGTFMRSTEGYDALYFLGFPSVITYDMTAIFDKECNLISMDLMAKDISSGIKDMSISISDVDSTVIEIPKELQDTIDFAHDNIKENASSGEDEEISYSSKSLEYIKMLSATWIMMCDSGIYFKEISPDGSVRNGIFRSDNFPSEKITSIGPKFLNGDNNELIIGFKREEFGSGDDYYEATQYDTDVISNDHFEKTLIINDYYYYRMSEDLDYYLDLANNDWERFEEALRAIGIKESPVQ